MRTLPFKYTKASSVSDALAAIAAGGVALAGGQSLVQMMKLRQTAPEHLVDLNGIDELRQIETQADGSIRIGALVRHADLIGSSIIQEHLPWLVQAASMIADVQVRNRGTIGGNLCWADCRANYAPVLIASHATAIVMGRDGQEKTLLVEELFTDFQRTVLKDELLVAIVISQLPQRSVGTYLEFSRQSNALSLVNIGVVLAGYPRATTTIAIGGLAPTPIRARMVEDRLNSADLSTEAVHQAADLLSSEPLAPIPDPHAPAEYRIRIGKVLLRRALVACLTSASIMSEKGNANGKSKLNRF